MNGRTLADHAVDYGKYIGADYVEARFIGSVNENYFCRNGKFLSIQKKPTRGMGIRVLKDGEMGFGSVDRLKEDEVESRIESIVKMCELTETEGSIDFSEEKIVEDSWEVPVKIPFEDISKDEKREFIKSLDKDIKKCGIGKFPFRSKLKNRILFFHTNSLEKYIVTSDGSRVNSEESFISLYSILNAKSGDDKEQRMIGLGSCSGWEWIEEGNLREKIIEQSKKLVNTVEESQNIKIDEEFDVIVGPEVSGIMAHENVGHPSEADRILGREEAQAGGSFYKRLLGIDDEKGKIRIDEQNYKIGSETISVVDDPTIEGSPGFYLYDDECVKAKKRYLIKNGELNELLLNREFAERFNTNSNAAARSAGYSREPIPRMSNTFFEPGNYSKEGLVEDVDKGVLIESFTEWNIDDRRFHSKYVGLESYLIEDGEVTNKMVKRPSLEMTTPALLKSIDAVSKDYEERMNFCGKSDPMQPVKVSTGGPYLRMRNIRVG
ncbi:MAG: TldD/PmbA family protein [Candidatus Thermoplasmatota archaeon]|nr:TldD/PmbA family protein [Candidatus Thermoplasmatota archaeon]MBS3789662.1 TldD/PmbA family protein [Candidatus Thermoplasmatota archaeon]